MKKSTAAILCMGVAMLASCGEKQSSSSEPLQNLAENADNVSTDAAIVAGQVPDADQANEMVNAAVDLSNATDKVDNTVKAVDKK